MTDSGTFVERVRALAADTPYLVEDTEDGFDVTLDVADAKWFALFYKESLAKVCVFHVKLDHDERRFTMADDVREVSWKAGAESRDGVPAPILSMKGSRMYGRVIAFEKQKVWAWNEHLEHGKVLDYSFTTNEGHSLIRMAAKDTGWNERMPLSMKIAITMGIIGGAGALITLIVLGVALLMGVKFD